MRNARSALWVLVPLLAACSSEKSLQAACDRGDPGACDVLSARYAYGDGVPRDGRLATELAARAMELCSRSDAGASASCTRYPVHAVPLDMPKAATSGEVQVVMSIVLAADGGAAVDGKAVPSDDSVLPLAQDVHAKNPELRVVIKADARVPHGRVIHVLDLLKQAGVSKIAFGVQPTPPTPAPTPGLTP